MGRLTKSIALAMVVIAAVFALAAIALFLFFDPNDFREDIEQAVNESTGRDLVIEGDMKLQVFPWLAVEVGHATLGNAPGFGDEPFAEFDRARLSVRLLPLLFRREVTIGAAELDALKLNLVVNKAGLRNWSDLLEADEGAASADAGEGGGSLEISGVEIRDASIAYSHAQNGDAYSLTNVNLSIGRISNGNDPVSASGSLRFDVQPIGYSGDIEIETEVVFDAETGGVSFNGAALEGVVEGIVSSPTRVGFSTAGIVVDSVKEIVSMQPVELGVLGLEIEADIRPFSYADAIEPKAAIRVAAFSPRSLMTLFDVQPPETADPVALSRLIMNADAAVGETAIALTNVNIKLDDTTFTGSLTVPQSTDGSYRFDLVGDAIDLNRYMEPPQEAASGEAAAASAPMEIPADLIAPINARGTLKIGSVVLGNLQLERVALGLNAANGRMRLHPISSDLYDGSYSGDVRIDVTGSKPVLTFDETVQDVDLAKLALAMFEQENITGSMNGNFKLTGRGQDMVELQRSLDGSMSFELKDGTYEGTDIWYELRRARAVLKQETPPEPVLPARTRFSSVTATGVVNDGVMQNDDLVADLPFMQLTGNGAVDIAAGTVDYSLRARVYKKPEALEDATPEEVDDFTKVVVPLKITGSLASPKVSPDVEELLRQRVEEEVKDKLEDKLKDLFKR